MIRDGVKLPVLLDMQKELIEVREKLRPTLWSVSAYSQPYWQTVFNAYEKEFKVTLGRGGCDSCLHKVWNWLETL